jgi:magnesium-transporting ATPase (P-type)
MSAAHALVIRDGQPRRLLAAEVVAGDMLLVEEGDTVAADARVVQSTGLQIAEAPLTGESVPVPKSSAAIGGDVPLGDRHNMIFAGATATYGRGRAVVVATGMRTEMGRIAGMLRDVPDAVITRRMWGSILVVGLIMAAGTLFVLDASLRGGFVEGAGELRYAQTMAFTTLMLFQLFNVFNARSDERSAFGGLFTNRWLWISVTASLVHAAVIYTPFLQQAFSTTELNVPDWLGCAAVASSVLWFGELAKAIIRWLKARQASALLLPARSHAMGSV